MKVWKLTAIEQKFENVASRLNFNFKNEEYKWYQKKRKSIPKKNVKNWSKYKMELKKAKNWFFS